MSERREMFSIDLNGNEKCFFFISGILYPKKIEIAMKFTLTVAGLDARHEYEIYSYLGAINNTKIEEYGLPCIYYYGQWEGCQMIGMSLLHPEFNNRFKGLTVNDLDVLILCREFVSSFNFFLFTLTIGSKLLILII